jgi:hypothetical protein
LKTEERSIGGSLFSVWLWCGLAGDGSLVVKSGYRRIGRFIQRGHIAITTPRRQSSQILERSQGIYRDFGEAIQRMGISAARVKANPAQIAVGF